MTPTLNELASQSFFWVDTFSLVVALYLWVAATISLVEFIEERDSFYPLRTMCFILSLLYAGGYIVYLYVSLYFEAFKTWAL